MPALWITASIRPMALTYSANLCVSTEVLRSPKTTPKDFETCLRQVVRESGPEIPYHQSPYGVAPGAQFLLVLPFILINCPVIEGWSIEDPDESQKRLKVTSEFGIL